ncbi:GtrA family protein [Maridesulfovibrio sp.]|uniref:GtrA family protein n=1 Tax=Maridesulfovibrio sp. TaxID=2795000 RepID=UPI002A187F93|nr:GtrA family protein [Maridesulfovibrio sp.]
MGGLGFVIDSGVTYLLVGLGVGSLAARIPAILIALTVCYRFHHGFTFRKGGRAPWSGWYKFALSNAVGSLVNYGAYVAVLFIRPASSVILAVAAGSIVAMIANYAMSVCYVFR